MNTLNYNKNNNIYKTNNNIFNYNKNNNIYNTIFKMNTFNYNKHNNIDNTNNCIQKPKTQEHWVLRQDQRDLGPDLGLKSIGS